MITFIIKLEEIKNRKTKGLFSFVHCVGKGDYDV